MATQKLGVSAFTTQADYSTSNAAFIITAASSSGVAAPSSGICNRLYYYSYTAQTCTMNFAVYDNTSGPNYAILSYRRVNKTFSVGWNLIEMPNFQIVSGNTYHIYVGLEGTNTYYSRDNAAGNTGYRDNTIFGMPPATWTGSTATSYAIGCYIEYDVSDFTVLSYSALRPVYRKNSAITDNSPTYSGGSGTITFSATGLPAGLSISETTGVISGTPSASQVSTMACVTASGSGGEAKCYINILVRGTLTTIRLWQTGGDYATSYEALNSLASKNLVTADIDLVLDVKGAINKYTGQTNNVNIESTDGWVTDEAHQITYQSSIANRHTGIRNSGAYFSGGYYSVYITTTMYVNFDGIGFGGYTGTFAIKYGLATSGVGYYKILNSLIWGDGSTGGGITIDSGNSVKTLSPVYIDNTFFYRCGSSTYPNAIRNKDGNELHVWNCTFINSLSYAISCYTATSPYVFLRNNACFGAGVQEIYSDSTAIHIYKLNNYCDDSSGNTQVTAASCNFVNITAGSEDGNITSGSSLINNGVSLDSYNTPYPYGDLYFPFSADYKGTARTSWDVGAVEYVASGGLLVGQSALVGGGVLCGQGNLIN